MSIKMKAWNGVAMNPTTVKGWIETATIEVLATLGEKDKDFCNISSGDTLVVAMRFGSDITVYECTVRATGKPE